MSVAASASITQRTSVPSQRKAANGSFHKLRLSEIKRWYLQRIQRDLSFQIITAAGAILQCLKILGKSNWKQKAVTIIELLKMNPRTFRYGLTNLIKGGYIGTEGEGVNRRLWWKQQPEPFRQDVANGWQDVANGWQDVANGWQDVANESPESIDVGDLHDSSRLSPDFYQTSFREEEFFEVEIEEEEVSQGEGVPELSVEPEDLIEEKTSHQNPGESSSSAAPPPSLNQHQAAGQSDPREKWLREKAPTLPKPIPPANIDRWVRTQLTEANWPKWEEDYRADSVGAVTHQATPEGFDAKISFLRKAGVELGVAWSDTRLIVRVMSQGRTLSAEEFMNEPIQALQAVQTVNFSDVLKGWRSGRG